MGDFYEALELPPSLKGSSKLEGSVGSSRNAYSNKMFHQFSQLQGEKGQGRVYAERAGGKVAMGQDVEVWDLIDCVS